MLRHISITFSIVVALVVLTTYCSYMYYVALSFPPLFLGNHHPDKCQQYQCDNFTKSNYCRHAAVWNDYKELHKQVITQQREGRFLKYVCNSLCGGYGNRIQGITLTLMFAILSNRTLLIEMEYPFDINVLLHPNAIQWNYKPTITNTRQQFILIDEVNLHRHWLRFSEAIFNLSIDMIELRTNLGFFYYYPVFDDKWIKQFHDVFGVSKKDYMFSYGCAIKYLFTYDKRVTHAIDQEMRQLQLVPGKYMSVHYRKLNAKPLPYLHCAVSIFNRLQNHSDVSKIYLISDSTAADEIANANYRDQIVTSHVRKLQVDRFKGQNLSMNSLIDGFVGVLVNIEVAAKGAVFIRTGSTLADLIEATGQFGINVYHCTG